MKAIAFELASIFVVVLMLGAMCGTIISAAKASRGYTVCNVNG